MHPTFYEENTMRRAIVLGLLATLIGSVLLIPGTPAIAADKDTAKDSAKGKVRHVVLFKFKDGTPAEKVKEIEKAFGELPSKIPLIEDFEWGTDMSVENLSQGFTHCFLVTFKDAKARDAYLPHPAHKAFVEMAGPHIDKALVVDYVVKD